MLARLARASRECLTFKDVVERLVVVGGSETEANLHNKISRGGFSAGFFVSCLTAIGAHTVRVRETD
jgi:hypothetical protein